MQTLLESWDRRCVDRPSDLALVSRGDDRRLDFASLAERSTTWQRLLAGDPRPVALAAPNGSAFVEAFVALRRLGVPVVSMDATGTAAARLDLCRRLGIARLIHRRGSSTGKPEQHAFSAEEPLSLPDGLDLVSTGAVAAEPPPGTILVKLTSGSTGEPLAACFSESSLGHGIRQIAEGMEITARDRVLMVLPLSHSYGFDNGVLSLLAVGTPLLLEPSVFPADLLRSAAVYEATVLPLVPPLVRSLARGRWTEATRLRRVICAGGVLPPDFAREFRDSTGLAVHNFYGSTETGGICFERRPEDPDSAGTVGTPLPGVEVTLDDFGRVRVDSAANWIGRLGESVASRRVVSTGDLAEWTPAGRLKLVGRSADLLNIGGRRVSALEVERALRAIDGVSEAAVVGVADAMRGDRAVAFLVTDRWPIPLGSVPSRWRPREIRRLESLPHNARGKLDRKLLRGLAESGNSEGAFT